MSLILIAVISLSVGAGVLLLLARDVFRMVLGLAVLGSAANLIVFMSSRPGGLVPPVMAADAARLPADAANPLPQALVLTAIVIGFALLCFALVLGARVAAQAATDDPDELHASEPPARDPVKPTVLEE
jgi:multicomponent Na+:H+ antiporter subunit C